MAALGVYGAGNIGQFLLRSSALARALGFPLGLGPALLTTVWFRPFALLAKGSRLRRGPCYALARCCARCVTSRAGCLYARHFLTPRFVAMAIYLAVLVSRSCLL